MPAQSKQQQKFMGLVHAIQKGDVPASDASPEAQKVAQDMKPSDVKDFASTSHKGLPKKVKQEIVKRLKEYAMTLPGHHSQPSAPMDSLRSDDEMDVQETRIPQNFNVGTTRDYHTKLATTPRKKYDKTNFNPAHSGQEDLEEAFSELEHLKLLNLAMKAMPGSPKQKEIIKKLNQVRIAGGMQPLKEISVDTIHKLADKKGIKWDNEPSFLKLTKQLTGKEHLDDLTQAELIKVKHYLEKQSDINSLKEASPCWAGYKQVGMKTKGGKQVPNCVKESVNELKLNDLVGNQYKYVIGSGEEKYLGKNDKKYVLEMIAKALKTYLYDPNFALSYLEGSQRKQYDSFFENEVLKPMLSKIDFTLNNFFTLDKDKVKWKLSSNDTRKMVDEIFRKNSKIPVDIKREYYEYRLDYAGVKLKESSKADIIKDLDKAKNDLLKKVDVLIAKKKKLYSNVDIESPMSADEKKLDKDIADLFSQLNKLVLQKRSLKEYGQALDLHFILNKDAKLDGTPEPKKAIGEELSFDEKQMVVGIIEILKQVQDPKNRMRIALNMLKKFKEENIEFDYKKFIDHLKEYSMGSYEYDKGNRELGESMIKSMKKVVIDLLPTNTLARHAGDPNRNKEFVEKIVKELGTLLNRFYKQNDIDVVLK